ncbi:type IV secretory system conjugative DNA transfer family protein, partial [Campylobacter concisus]|uniref:type IV secretory system conjugative DNA transfer family protein n=1 Tax=Campylobacter concisus TaxID=199 RepID=UPI00112FA7B3
IRSNAGYQTIFAMNTTKDAKEVSELIGDFTREKTSTSQGNLDFFKSNNTKSKEAYKLVTDQDIKNQSSDDLLVLVTGFLNRPIKAKVPYWFKNEDWKEVTKYKVEKQQQEKQEQEQTKEQNINEEEKQIQKLKEEYNKNNQNNEQNTQEQQE